MVDSCASLSVCHWIIIHISESIIVHPFKGRCTMFVYTGLIGAIAVTGGAHCQRHVAFLNILKRSLGLAVPLIILVFLTDIWVLLEMNRVNILCWILFKFLTNLNRIQHKMLTLFISHKTPISVPVSAYHLVTLGNTVWMTIAFEPFAWMYNLIKFQQN